MPSCLCLLGTLFFWTLILDLIAQHLPGDN